MRRLILSQSFDYIGKFWCFESNKGGHKDVPLYY